MLPGHNRRKALGWCVEEHAAADHGGRGLRGIFQVADLAGDCHADKVFEFMFVAPAIPITGAVGSPVNPLAIK